MIPLHPHELAVLLFLAHFLADYPLQGDFLARAKNYRDQLPGVSWIHALFAHSFIHGAFVFLITGIWWLGALELAAHFLIDFFKCGGKLTFSEDQWLHFCCKILWMLFLV